jgi:hypothetical protein
MGIVPEKPGLMAQIMVHCVPGIVIAITAREDYDSNMHEGSFSLAIQFNNSV